VDEVHWVSDMAKVLNEKGINRVHTLVRLSANMLPFSSENAPLSAGGPQLGQQGDVRAGRVCRQGQARRGQDGALQCHRRTARAQDRRRAQGPSEKFGNANFVEIPTSQVLRYAVAATNAAHKEMMRIVKAGLYEYQLERCVVLHLLFIFKINPSTFRYSASFSHGCRHVGYTCISGSGPNGAVLHYGHAGLPNERELNNGDLCMTDMGAEYACYSMLALKFPAKT